MILLHDVIEAINNSPLCEGWLVGGVVERGWSNRDADLIVSDAKVAEGLPPYFDVIVQEKKPEGPSIPVAGLKALQTFDFEFMKPVKTSSVSNEFYNIEDFKSLKDGYYFIEPKYDGIRAQIRKAGYKVWILTDEGNDITDKLPGISEEARTKIPFTVCVLDCELAAYRGLQRLDHSAVTAFLRSKTPPEDYHMRLKPFDIVFLEGADYREKPLEDRKKVLEKVPWGEMIHPVKYKLVKSSEVAGAIEEVATSEGAMIKDSSSTYNKAGNGWYKWKRQYEVDAQVIAVEKKEGGFVYKCRVGTSYIGDTYVTSIDAKIGDIVTVSVDHISKKKDGSWGWYSPKVKEIRSDKKSPDPESVLQKLWELAKVEGKEVDTQQVKASESTTTQKLDADAVSSAITEAKNLPLSEGHFVLQEHWWGEKHHFDLRFEKKNAMGKPIMIGWTLLADSLEELHTRIKDNVKILSKRKLYHDAKWLTFHGEIPPGNEGNPTKNFTAHMYIRETGTYKFNRRQTDFVDVELSGTKNSVLNGRFYLRLVKLNNDSQGNPKPASEDTSEDWMFWKAKVQESIVNKTVTFIAESVKVIESDTPAQDKEFVDVEITVLSTGVTANGRQYTLEDLEKNVASLNEAGGLIFAMGKHPDLNQEPDAKDNIGVGKAYIEDGKLKSKPRVYNTSTFPDMVKRIRLGLVRDVSIEGVARRFQKVCNGDGCWQRAFGLTIHRAVFVSAGADPIARIEKIIESLEGDTKSMTQTKEGAPAPATVVVESAPEKGIAAPAGAAAAVETKSGIVAEAAPVIEAKIEPASTEAAGTPAEVAPTPEAKPGVTLAQVLGVCMDLKTIMASMADALAKAADSVKGNPTESAREAARPESTVTAEGDAVKESARPEVTESQPEETVVEKPPRVKESGASPINTTSSFFEDVKKLVR